jgi:acetyl-CoA synthetase
LSADNRQSVAPEEKVANESLEGKIFDVPAEFRANAWISSMEQYQEMYRRSIEDADAFWAEQAEQRLHWYKKWDRVQNHDFANAKVRWFEGGKLNVSYNCLDRHLDGPVADKVAYYFAALGRSHQVRQRAQEEGRQEG